MFLGDIDRPAVADVVDKVVVGGEVFVDLAPRKRAQGPWPAF